MKKFLLALFVLVANVAMANPVSKSTAKGLAAQFLTSSRLHKAKGLAENVKLTDAYEASGYYVFNVGEKNGYMILSASDKTQPVLGYSDSGEFDLNAMPLPMQEWLAELTTAINGIEGGTLKLVAPLQSPEGPQRVKSVTKTAIPYLVTCKWNQGGPYNDLCPDHSGGRCATGCVATAMAQVMYYWKCPQQECNAIPDYRWNHDGTSTLLKGYEPYRFNWEAMTDTYSDASTSASKKAVAELMRYVGQAVQMGYGPASGAGIGMIAPALINYFGYDESAHHVGHDEFTYQEWEDLIYSEIAAGRPILMNAHCAGDNGGGHEFVIDGFDGNGYYHVNWGWGGMDDGYFLLTVMSPDNQGIGGSDSSDGYSMGQGIVIGIQPSSGESQEKEPEVVRKNIGNLKINKTSLTRTRKGGAFSVTITFSMGTSLQQEYDFDNTFTLYDAAGNIVKESCGAEYKVHLSPGTWWPERTLVATFGQNCDPGTYYLKGRSRQSGTTEWNLDRYGDKYYIRAEITDDYHCDVYVCPETKLNVQELKVIGTQSVGSEQKVETVITNEGDDFYGDLYLLEDGVWKSGNCVFLPGGKTNSVFFKYKPETVKEHALAVSRTDNSSGIIWSTKFTPAESTRARLTYSAKILSEGDTNGNIYGNKLRLELTVRNSGADPYNSFIEVSPWEVSGGMYWKRASYKQNIYVPERGTTVVIFEIPDLNIGSRYNFHFDSNNCGSGNKGDYTFVEGILYWTEDGVQHGGPRTAGAVTLGKDAVACMINGKSSIPSVAIEDEYNPNLVFYFQEGATVASRTLNVLKSKVKNIVYGNAAEEIVIDDAYPFYVLRDITAQNVTYTRNIPAFEGGDNYTTLVLPFTPQTVTTEDGAVTLQTEDYVAVNDNHVFLEESDGISPNIPYVLTLKNDDYNLSGKTLTMTASDALLPVADRISVYGSNYTFVGTLLPQQVSEAYVLSPKGTHFQKQAVATIDPFRAYFVGNNDGAREANGVIIDGRGTDADGISELFLTGDDKSYNLQGIRVAEGYRGIIIKNGKKYVK